jgi:hypothetical protein
MKKLIVGCGDSFNYGIGCVNLHTQPYPVLVAKHFDCDLIRLSRGSASNFIVHLQGMFAAKMNPKPNLVILGTTSTDRVEWLAEGKQLNRPPTLKDVNYHLYPPHHHPPPCHDSPMDFYLKNDKEYSPKILSEQIVALPDYLAKAALNQHNKAGYYERLYSEPLEKLELIKHHYFDIVDSRIKHEYDHGVILMAYNKIKKAGIQCIICSGDHFFKTEVNDPRDFFDPDWGRCTQTWPDSVGSLHTGEGGHADIAERLIHHINENGFNI